MLPTESQASCCKKVLVVILLCTVKHIYKQLLVFLNTLEDTVRLTKKKKSLQNFPLQ